MPPAMGSGPYTVNPDCTRTAVIHTQSSFTGIISVHIVAVERGKEIRQVVDKNPVTAIAVRLDLLDQLSSQ